MKELCLMKKKITEIKKRNVEIQAIINCDKNKKKAENIDCKFKKEISKKGQSVNIMMKNLLRDKFTRSKILEDSFNNLYYIKKIDNLKRKDNVYFDSKQIKEIRRPKYDKSPITQYKSLGKKLGFNFNSNLSTENLSRNQFTNNCISRDLSYNRVTNYSKPNINAYQINISTNLSYNMLTNYSKDLKKNSIKQDEKSKYTSILKEYKDKILNNRKLKNLKSFGK